MPHQICAASSCSCCLRPSPLRNGLVVIQCPAAGSRASPVDGDEDDDCGAAASASEGDDDSDTTSTAADLSSRCSITSSDPHICCTCPALHALKRLSAASNSSSILSDASSATTSCEDTTPTAAAAATTTTVTSTPPKYLLMHGRHEPELRKTLSNRSLRNQVCRRVEEERRVRRERCEARDRERELARQQQQQQNSTTAAAAATTTTTATPTPSTKTRDRMNIFGSNSLPRPGRQQQPQPQPQPQDCVQAPTDRPSVSAPGNIWKRVTAQRSPSSVANNGSVFKIPVSLSTPAITSSVATTTTSTPSVADGSPTNPWKSSWFKSKSRT